MKEIPDICQQCIHLHDGPVTDGETTYDFVGCRSEGNDEILDIDDVIENDKKSCADFIGIGRSDPTIVRKV